MLKARFIEPMLLLGTENRPESFDGYKALAIKTGGKVHLRPRNDNDFSSRHPAIVKALALMPLQLGCLGRQVPLISSGVVGGLNNKAKVTMKKSYGFRTYRVLELALYHSLGKLPEPESTHDFF
jgi:hypothetical protein